jgi:hypothetical protein
MSAGGLLRRELEERRQRRRLLREFEQSSLQRERQPRLPRRSCHKAIRQKLYPQGDASSTRWQKDRVSVALAKKYAFVHARMRYAASISR